MGCDETREFGPRRARGGFSWALGRPCVLCVLGSLGVAGMHAASSKALIAAPLALAPRARLDAVGWCVGGGTVGVVR
jgi:hypothetical protein